MIAQKLVADAIEFVCGDSGRDIAADLGKGLGAKPSGDPHQFDRFRVFDLWPHIRSNARFADVLGARD